MHWLGESGDIAGAIEQSRVLVMDRLRVLGEDAAGTIMARDRLARWLANQATSTAPLSK